jgi:hypothetical protein
MGKKPKTGRDLGTDGGKKTQEKTQAERFIETAREIGVDETGQEFERAMRKVAPPRKR